MSQTFRPVKEEWGPQSSMFLEREQVQEVLELIADRVNSSYCYEDYGDLRTVWIDKGNDFIRYLSHPDFVSQTVADRLEWKNASDLQALVSNMRSFAADWARSVDNDGSLRFYID